MKPLFIGKLVKFEFFTRAGTVPGSNPEKRVGALACSISHNEFNQNVLLPNGDVYLCCMDYELKHRLGNLFLDDYKSLQVKREKIKRLLVEDDDVICRKCIRVKNLMIE